MHNVTVLNDVFLAFYGDFTIFATCGFCLECFVIRKLDDLSFDKATLEVCMDDTCCGRSFPAFFDGPSANFLFACCEIGDQVKEVIGSSD